MRKNTLKNSAFLMLGLVLAASVLYWLPPVHSRLSWRVDFALTYLRGMVYPVSELPTALPPPQVYVTRQVTATPTSGPTLTPTPGPTATPLPSPTPIPGSVALEPPPYEKQDINNCGPASLTMYLRYYGWEGDQYTIADVIKPQREDRNVNVEELAYFVGNHVGWLKFEYRVGGDIALLKNLLAAGIPVMIEEAFKFDESYWPNDDQWAAHYFLVTGYDDESQMIIGQDSYYGANKKVSYELLDQYWQTFNRVYILIYPPEKEATVQSLLGTNWDRDTNRQHALEVALAETKSDPENAFAWFNLGTNYVYFEQYAEASAAYDTARNLGLPQRMLRYQFGPFIAYFHNWKMEDLQALTEYALERTPNAEEALLWHGWVLYRQNNVNGAVEEWRKALAENPHYQDAQYALDFVNSNP